MSNNDDASQIMVKQVLRLAKDDSAFVYFTLEANEGLCFYSTLEFVKGQAHRDIELMCSESTSSELDKVLTALKKEVNYETISKSTFKNE